VQRRDLVCVVRTTGGPVAAEQGFRRVVRVVVAIARFLGGGGE
jgi:hypothetical protein